MIPISVIPLNTNFFMHYIMIDIVLVLFTIYFAYLQTKVLVSKIVLFILLQNSIKCLIVYFIIKMITTIYFLFIFKEEEQMIEPSVEEEYEVREIELEEE